METSNWGRARGTQLTTCTLAFAFAASCAHVSTVRVQPENIAAPPGLRPVAAIQANAISFYFLFVSIPGGVDLDRVVNRMLIATAKAMGADKVIYPQFDVTPSGGVWSLRKLLGWRSASARGIAVKVDAVDVAADDGPEPTPSSSPPPAPATGPVPPR